VIANPSYCIKPTGVARNFDLGRGGKWASIHQYRGKGAGAERFVLKICYKIMHFRHTSAKIQLKNLKKHSDWREHGL